LQAPFYPIEAEAKGANSAQYGVVFGIIHLAMFLAGPLFGRFMPRLGVRSVFVFGVLGTAVCSCAFGLLTFLPTMWSFLDCSYALR
jgi:MFS family permease